MKATISLEGLLALIHGLSLSASNKRWLGEKLILDEFLSALKILPISNAIDLYASEKARLRMAGTPADGETCRHNIKNYEIFHLTGMYPLRYGKGTGHRQHARCRTRSAHHLLRLPWTGTEQGGGRLVHLGALPRLCLRPRADKREDEGVQAFLPGVPCRQSLRPVDFRG